VRESNNVLCNDGRAGVMLEHDRGRGEYKRLARTGHIQAEGGVAP